MPELFRFALIFLVGVIGAFINVNAGGGSTLTLPALIFLGLDGALATVPLEHDAYYDALERPRYAMHPVAKVDSYKGLVFGTFDAKAPLLDATNDRDRNDR